VIELTEKEFREELNKKRIKIREIKKELKLIQKRIRTQKLTPEEIEILENRRVKITKELIHEMSKPNEIEQET